MAGEPREWNPLAAPLRPGKCVKRRGHNRMKIQWLDWLPNGRAHCQECGGRIKSMDGQRPREVAVPALSLSPWARLLQWLRRLL